ncbi:hypothetical protein SMULJ23_1846 [Streptococcus mutans LJ23]|nr:hypothetical protein SMULJ23_1846 [Streptococcus mutans LJ23]
MFPQAKIGIVLLKKFQSQKRSPKPIIELLKKSNELAKTYLVEDNFSDNAEIQVHRKAYQRFKTKKEHVRVLKHCSSELATINL